MILTIIIVFLIGFLWGTTLLRKVGILLIWVLFWITVGFVWLVTLPIRIFIWFALRW